MDVNEIAKSYYLEGYNCCESVLKSLHDFGILEFPEIILKSVSVFRGGFGGKGCICGVVVAAGIAISIKISDKQQQQKLSKIFYDKFIEKFSSTCCKVLTRRWKDSFNSNERKNFCLEIISVMSFELKELLK